MKRRRHVLGGVLLMAAAVVLAAGEWAVFDARVIIPLATAVGLVGLANVAIGLGRPTMVRARQDPIVTVTFLVFALLGLAIVVEDMLAPDGPVSYLRAPLWGLVVVVFGWHGVNRLRTEQNGSDDGHEP